MNLNHALLAEMPMLAARYRAGELTSAAYAARCVLQWQRACHGSRIAQRRSRRDPKPEVERWLTALDALPSAVAQASLIEWLERYDLRGVSRRVNESLIGWLRGEWPLTLCEHVPATREVLRMQVRGTRPVTVIAAYPQLLEPIEHKIDAFEFICHDLEHAWQFFHDPASHAAQRRFAAELEHAVDTGAFDAYVTDREFAEKFDYLAADMNTHVAHSMQYLRAILLEFYLREEGKGLRDEISPSARDRLGRCLERFSLVEGFAVLL